jgi:predicted Zn-dependent protease
MTSYLHLTRTVHLPVTAHGSVLSNSFGVTIATAVDPTTAAALSDLVNLGHGPAAALDKAHDEQEDARASRLFRARTAVDPARHPIEPLAEEKQPADRVAVVKAAIIDLRRIRTDLRKVGAGMAADYVQRALKSVEGALRHAERLESEASRS